MEEKRHIYDPVHHYYRPHLVIYAYKFHGPRGLVTVSAFPNFLIFGENTKPVVRYSVYRHSN